MDVVKKNIVSITCGVVAILAICALFWPTSGWASKLQEDLNNSKKNYADKIDSLMKTKRNPPPTLDLTGAATDAQPLGVFPTKSIIDLGETYRKTVTEQSQKMLEAAIERNRHQPIISFNAQAGLDSFSFQHAYDRWLALPGATIDDPNAPTIKTVLQATLPPNSDEVNAEKNRIWETKFKDRIYYVDGQPRNEAQVKEEFDRATSNLEDELRRQRAENFKVYLDPDSIAYSPSFAPNNGRQATPDQIWYAQNMLWIDQDVADAIARVNQSAKNITESPVKQLVKIDIASDFNQYQVFRAANSTGASSPDQPPPPPDDNALQGKAYNVSETGRVCNPLYDVIQFHLELNVDARKIPAIISELQRGHLITVYRMDSQVVDARGAVEEGGYVYGTAPIAHLWLECEELFMRGWTVDPKHPLMPAPVQARLGIAQANAQ